jgi:hypothetical protein
MASESLFDIFKCSLETFFFNFVDDLLNARQLGPWTTRTETSRPVSEENSVRMLRQLGPYVKTTRTILLFYNIVQYLYVYNYLFI